MCKSLIGISRSGVATRTMYITRAVRDRPKLLAQRQ
jgi:hypothetical protein